jgi:CBS domain-containing protein
MSEKGAEQMFETQPKTVAEVMTRRLATLRADDTIADVEKGMYRLRVRHVPVVDGDGKLVGLVSHPDLLHAASSTVCEPSAEQNAVIDRVHVGRVMQQEILTARPDDSLIEAGKLMWDAKVGCLPVVEPDGTLVGILTEADFVRVAVDLLGGQIKKSDVEELAHAQRHYFSRQAAQH